MLKNSCTNIIILIILFLILGLWYIQKKSKQNPNLYQEPFDTTNVPQHLDNYYLPASTEMEHLLVDKMACSPECCGESWYTPFDGLTANEIQQTIATSIISDNGKHIRTNYSCGNGENGSGCPCFTNEGHANLVNRGQNKLSNIYTWPKNTLNEADKIIPYEEAQLDKSIYADYPKLNDLELQREPHNLSNIKSYGSY